jgi:hypothetical protein
VQNLNQSLKIPQSNINDKIADELFQREAEAAILHNARIIANTKFEQVEQLQLDGFPSNNYIYCIEPATGDKNSFDVGTYGMIK